jgi:hypothetical protein
LNHEFVAFHCGFIEDKNFDASTFVTYVFDMSGRHAVGMQHARRGSSQPNGGCGTWLLVAALAQPEWR